MNDLQPRELRGKVKLRRAGRGVELQKYLFIAVVIISIVSYIAQDLSTAVPPIQPQDSPAGTFSGQRAYDVLTEIIKHNEPHPTGSAANHAVRERILRWLRDHDIDATVQSAWGCSNVWGRCAPVHNIIAKLPGEPDKPYITLMAHYDSTPASDGVGDNGAGVATIMEVGRLMKAKRLVNPIMLLITDAEENGLLGAEAFFAQHPDKDKVAVVINLEASTTTGRSFLFRTSKMNRQLVRIYGNTAHNPGGTSLYNEVFKRMASDTDLTVPLRLGIPALDFVFVGEKSHHHTANDSLANLDLRSLQHHGDNIYPLTNHLATQALNLSNDDEVIFLNLFGAWLSWSTSLNPWFLGIALTLLLISAQRSVTDWRLALASTALPLALFFTIAFTSGSAFLVVHFLNGTTPFWPAHLEPYRMILFGIPFAIGIGVAQRVNRDIPLPEALVGVWLFWGLLAIGFTIWLPSASYLYVLPLFFTGIVVLLASFIRTEWSHLLYVFTLPAVVALHLQPVLLLEQSQGYWFVAVTFVFIALYTATAVPLVRGLLTQAALRFMLLLALVGGVLAVVLPGFSSSRPQTAIYQVVENIDLKKAWLQFLSLNATPEAITSIQPFNVEAPIFPWSKALESSLIEIDPTNLTPPVLNLVGEVRSDSDRWVTLKLSSPRGARDLGIVIAAESRAASYVVGGREYAFEPMDWGTWKGQYALEFRGIKNQTIELKIRFEDTSAVRAYLYDITAGIPETFDNLIAARVPLVVQVHQGDRTLAISEVTF